MYKRGTEKLKTSNVKGGGDREKMKLGKDYIIGLTILIAGLILNSQNSHIVGGIMIGVGFILILKSYGN